MITPREIDHSLGQAWRKKVVGHLPKISIIDLDADVIVDVEATPALRTDEVNATQTMIDRVEERFDMKPERLVGDAPYGAAPMLNWLVHEKQIEPHVPVLDKTERDDGTLSRWTSFSMNKTTDTSARKGSISTRRAARR